VATASKPKVSVKVFKIRYPLSDYTFPKKVKIAKVRFDETHMHVTLTDERIISIPLKWIPTLYHAKSTERQKYKINQTKRMLIWDPAECEINEEIRIEDYLGPMKAGTGDYSQDRHERLDKYTVDDIAKMVGEKKTTYKTGKKKK
jgi:hypothetical protein